MPPEFDRCAGKKGAKIRTKTLKGGKYVHICAPPGGGSSVAGYVKRKKSKKKR